MTPVVIVGGGITGLVAAYRLNQLAPDLPILLIERDERLGGKIATARPDGFIIEGGPDCFLSRKPRGLALCEELGVTERLQGRDTEYTATYVKRHGELHPLPEGLTGMVPTNLEALRQSALLTDEGRARLAEELTLPPAPGDEDESVAAFIGRRMGREVFEQIVEPLMGGIYAGDAEQLSLAATFPQLRALEKTHGSLIEGLLARDDEAEDGIYPPFLSFRSGMEELVESLRARLGEAVTVHLGRAVEAIAPTEGGGWSLTLDEGETIEAAALILTTPAFVTAALVAPWDNEMAEAHAAIPYASSATVSLAFDEADLPAPLAGRGYVIPRVEDEDVLACTWTSSKWAGRAPEGKALIRVYLGRFGGRDLMAESDEALLDMARQELADTMQLTAEPLFHAIYRWPRSMPQYNLGHPARVATIEARAAAWPTLFLAGAAYRGVGIPDCIREAERAASGAWAVLQPES